MWSTVTKSNRQPDSTGLFPMPDQETLARLFEELASVLRQHDFAATETLPLPGDARHLMLDSENLRRYLKGDSSGWESSALAALFYRHFAAHRPNTLLLFTVFTLTRPVARTELEALIGEDIVSRMLDLSILVEAEGRVVSRLQATAVGGRIQFHDHYRIQKPDQASHVFLGRCSLRLARHLQPWLSSRRLDRGLDLCTGSGVQAMLLAHSCEQVVGGDVNPRALAFARANARGNGVSHVTFVESNVYQNIEGTFDVITANTPFFLLPPGSNALSGNGGYLGMEIGNRLYEGLDEHLRPGGHSAVIASSAISGKRNLLGEKLTEFFGGKGYEIDMYPITLHFPPVLYGEFERQGVHHSVLYLVDLHKRGSRFRLDIHQWPPVVRQAHELQMSARRLVGWARHTLA